MGRCSVPDRESEELLCKDLRGGDTLSARSAVSGTEGVFSAVLIVIEPLFLWDGGIFLPPGGHAILTAIPI